MYYNNEVKNWHGEVIGFRCLRCGGVFHSMWGTTCNNCSHQDDENEKLREEIRNLTEALKKS